MSTPRSWLSISRVPPPAPIFQKRLNTARLRLVTQTDVFAYGEAARQLERALQVQELVDATDVGKRCELLLSLGEALGPLGDHERVIGQLAPEAAALAEIIGDHHQAFRACHLAVQYLEVQNGPMSTIRPDYVEWAQPRRSSCAGRQRRAGVRGTGARALC